MEKGETDEYSELFEDYGWKENDFNKFVNENLGRFLISEEVWVLWMDAVLFVFDAFSVN